MDDGKIHGRTVDTGNPTVVEYIRQNTDDHGERDMAKNFPLFVDVSNKKMIVYGAGKIASRRVETLLAFAPSLTVIAPEASDRIRRAAEQHLLYHRTERYIPGSIPKDTFLVLAATDDQAVNEAIWQECRKKQILVNAHLSDKLQNQTVLLPEQTHQKMFLFNLLIAIFISQLFQVVYSLNGFLCKFADVHKI